MGTQDRCWPPRTGAAEMKKLLILVTVSTLVLPGSASAQKGASTKKFHPMGKKPLNQAPVGSLPGAIKKKGGSTKKFHPIGKKPLNQAPVGSLPGAIKKKAVSANKGG